MYKIKPIATVIILVIICLTHASILYAQTELTEEQAVQNIETISKKLVSETENSSSLNKEKILNHLYEQIRPNIELSRDNVTDAEINEKTKQYIEMGYYPALTQNYIDLYNAMKQDNVNLTACNKDLISPFTLRSLKATLCVKSSKDNNSWIVLYSAYDDIENAFNTAASFIFSSDQMIGIDMMKSDGVKYRIQGL